MDPGVQESGGEPPGDALVKDPSCRQCSNTPRCNGWEEDGVRSSEKECIIVFPSIFHRTFYSNPKASKAAGYLTWNYFPSQEKFIIAFAQKRLEYIIAIQYSKKRKGVRYSKHKVCRKPAEINILTPPCGARKEVILLPFNYFTQAIPPPLPPPKPLHPPPKTSSSPSFLSLQNPPQSHVPRHFLSTAS